MATNARKRADEHHAERDDDESVSPVTNRAPDEQTIEIRDTGPVLQTRQTRQDQVRARLAYVSLGLFATAMIFGFVGAFAGEEAWDRTKDYLQIIVPVITLLIGGTAGHYFGRHV